MSDTPFQSDLMVVYPQGGNSKCTLSVSPTGDLQLVTGKNKLITQMLRAIVNDNVFNGGILNSKSGQGRVLNTLVTTVLRGFRDNQISYVSQSNPDLTGYAIWRKNAGTDDDFVKISTKGVVWKYVDTTVLNGHKYTYGVSKIFQNVFESKFVDMLDVTPTGQTSSLQIITGSSSTMIPGSNSVTIYVDYNKRFAASELLETLVDISAEQSTTDPRAWRVLIKVKNLKDDQVIISSVQFISGA